MSKLQIKLDESILLGNPKQTVNYYNIIDEDKILKGFKLVNQKVEDLKKGDGFALYANKSTKTDFEYKGGDLLLELENEKTYLICPT